MELDGQPVDPQALGALALTDYGHFTTMRVEEGRVRGLALHMERLVRDCRVVFGAEVDPERVRALARRAVEGVDGACVVRVTVFDPALDIGHMADPAHPRVLVTRRPAPALPLPPLRVRSVRHERELPAVKHTGLFGILHARRVAQRDGFDDALFVGADGLVSEGGTWNVAFIDREGTVVWPKAEVLPGVTMALLRAGHAHTVAPVGPEEVAGMRAAFATNAAIGVRAIAAVDDVRFPAGHPGFEAVRAAYLAEPGDAL
nr:aminotranferase [Streptomyces sp.]